MPRLEPNSGGTDEQGYVRPLREFNPCHSPQDGKFCSGSGGSVDRTAMMTHAGRLERNTPIERVRAGDFVDAATAVGSTQKNPGGFWRVKGVTKRKWLGYDTYILKTAAGSRELKPGSRIDRYVK